MDGSGEKERKKESNADTSVLPVALLKVITVHYTSPHHDTSPSICCFPQKYTADLQSTRPIPVLSAFPFLLSIIHIPVLSV